MNGSTLASYIDEEYRKRKSFEKKKRQECIIDNNKQCNKCKYENICLDKEEY